ncbi:MAG: ABC transporter substrate-binding protein [Pseudomonadota bacterium]
MRQFVLSLCLICWGSLTTAFEIEDQARFGPAEAATTLNILSTTDTAIFAPMIESYLAITPDTAIAYTVASSTDVAGAVIDGDERFDLVISSAMDLQIKLANDGYARPHISAVTRALPEWARWNDMVFAFTQEPAAIVLSDTAFAGLTMPRSREELISLLRRHPDRFAGKVGTYDLRISGLGYLFATQESRVSETYWRLTQVMGGLNARLYCCSSQMIDDVASGDLAVAYNVLGSYALQREGEENVHILFPSDFTALMLRTVLIPQTATAPDAAGAFLDHMVGQAHSGGNGPFGIDRWLGQSDAAALRRIDLGPGLLVYLDRLKRAAFETEWTNAILQQ